MPIQPQIRRRKRAFEALWGYRIAAERASEMAGELSRVQFCALPQGTEISQPLYSSPYISGFVLFENNSKDEAEITLLINGQDYKFSFNDLSDEESGSWAPMKDVAEVGFSLALAPMVSRYLDDGGSKSEISEYESSIIGSLNALQSDLMFKRGEGKYRIVMEVVSADEDDAELRGWAYLYDNTSLEKLAASKIRAEGGRGSSFNLRLEKSLKKAAKNLLSVIRSGSEGQ